jgi:hypothetical protein
MSHVALLGRHNADDLCWCIPAHHGIDLLFEARACSDAVSTFAGVRRANDWQSNRRTGYECRQHDRVDLRHFAAMNLGYFLTIHQHIDNVIDVS